MLPLETWPAGIMLLALTVYALTGGADFGGGVWDLFARGKRAADQRRVIARAIGPIWEANHVWLILIVVLAFVAYPKAFATIMTALHVPLVLMLVGVMLRGSAFVFRTYDTRRDEVQRRWSRVFSAGSIIAPFFLGASIGAMASGSIRVAADGTITGGWWAPWLAPFPLAVGVFTLALFATLSATYLADDADDDELVELFRRKALAAWAVAGVAAWATLGLAASGAPLIWHQLVIADWAIPFQILIGLVAVGSAVALARRAFRAARLLAMALVVLAVWGFGMAQFPWLVVPDLHVLNTAAPASVLEPVLLALVIGAIPTVPSFLYLYAVFRREPVPAEPSRPPPKA